MKITKRKIGLGLIIISLIILPTMTPEDLVTTIPLLSFLGYNRYWELAKISILLLGIGLILLNGKKVSFKI